ncbi:MAG: prepilin-type N-terminal cleavage/methylation domain-containing protein [Planctomycetaceae bacterium]|nr:prepilin-type N-terminal cleavage/methylation domain-containing protein [Planctomycetaceae bacterium]
MKQTQLKLKAISKYTRYAEAVLKFEKLNTAAQQRVAVVRGRSLSSMPVLVYGFTLVEVLIALVLMVIILGMVSISIDIYLRQMVVHRSGVEETQLARALLDRIAHEIRAVVVQPAETESVAEEINTDLLISIFGSSETTANTTAAANSAINTITDTNSNASTNTNSEEGEQSSDSTVSLKGQMPGIYGESNWIQIDTVRLPRGELFGSQRMRVGSQYQTDRLSSTKTVYYYLGKDTGTITDASDPRYKPDQLIGSLGRVTDLTAVQYGLFRREFDRQVTQYVLDEGKESEYEQYDEVIAPEVEWIEFLYFDPSAATSTNTAGDWVDYWDMDEKKTFPKAIKITVAIRRQIFGDALINFTEATGGTTPTNVYSRIVLLPIESEEPATEENEEL